MSTEDHPDWWRPVGGQNSQDSILERRSLVWNDDGIEDGTVPDNIYEGIRDKGKFFTRGCRGMIEQIQVYCIGDGADTLVLRYSPFPGIGPFREVTITPAAAWAWQNFNIGEMWNYDSLFIWAEDVYANVDWAYDAVQPHDGHYRLFVPERWEDEATRPFFRVVYTGETPGDVPVSGTLNVIDIPSVATEGTAGEVASCPHGVLVPIVAFQNGAGTLLEARAVFETSIAPTGGDPPAGVYYAMHLFVDEAWVVITSNRDLTQSPVATSGRSSVGEFYQMTVADPAYDRTVMTLRMPIKFQRFIMIGLYQSTGGAVDVTATLFTNLLR